MTPEDPHLQEELDPELRDLFAAERVAPIPGEEVAARVMQRLTSSIAAPLVPDASSSSATAHVPNGAIPQHGALTAASGAAAKATSLLVAGAFGVGALVGAGSYAALRPTEPAQTKEIIRYVEVPARAPTLPPATTETPATRATAEPIPSAVGVSGTTTKKDELKRKEPAPSGVEPSRDAGLADENLLIARAQTALGRGDAEAALVALGLHKSRYPNGQLVFERGLLEKEALKLRAKSPPPKESLP